MYEVIKFFTDLQDNNYAYHVGDTFPHEGLSVSSERLAELSGKKNKRGVPVIKKTYEKPIIEEQPKKPIRGKKKG